MCALSELATATGAVMYTCYDLGMSRYRFDFQRSEGDVFATHEIDHDSDEAAIVAGHTINGSAIGCSFLVWRDGNLIHRHYNRAVVRA